MSGKNLRAKDKRVNKMTRDGLVERNAATGEDIRVTKREAELDLGGKLKQAPLSRDSKRPDGRHPAARKNSSFQQQQDKTAPHTDTAEVRNDTNLRFPEKEKADTVIDKPKMSEKGNGSDRKSVV